MYEVLLDIGSVLAPIPSISNASGVYQSEEELMQSRQSTEFWLGVGHSVKCTSLYSQLSVSQPTLWLFPQFLERIVGIDIISNQQNPTFGPLCHEMRATMEKLSSTLRNNMVFLEELQIKYIKKNLKDAEILATSPFNSHV